MSWLIARVLFIPSLCWNVLLERLGARHWWDRVDDRLLVGAFPFASHVPRLASEGVRAVVNTCEEYAGPAAAYARANIVQLRIPTIDFQPPTIEDIQHAVAFIDQHVENGHSVYVHCKAGRGRSATVALCWLMQRHGWTPEEAQRHLQDKRPHVSRRLFERKVVREFWEKFHR